MLMDFIFIVFVAFIAFDVFLPMIFYCSHYYLLLFVTNILLKHPNLQHGIGEDNDISIIIPLFP